MDGLASLAAAADMLGEYEAPENSSLLSPSKQKRAASSNVDTPKKKKPKKGVGSPLPVRSPHRGLVLDDALSMEIPPSPLPKATSIDLDRHGVGNQSLLASITQRFSANVLRWCTYEWFYSTLDREYFNENEFNACLDCLGVQEFSHLSRHEWSALRTIMGSKIGRPRRFSHAFVTSERARLHDYRQNVRAIQNGRAVSEDFHYNVPPAISIGDCVTAVHSGSGLLIRGQVLTLEANHADESPSCRVQFEYPVMFTAIIEDRALAVHGETPSVKLNNKIPVGTATGTSDDGRPGDALLHGTNNVISDRRQWEHAATLQYFLERKEYLLESLKVLNNLAEQELLIQSSGRAAGVNTGDSTFTDNFITQHQWVIDNILRTDDIIRQLLQQLSNDPSLSRKSDVLFPPTSDDSGAIEVAWNQHYEQMVNISISAAATKDSRNNSSGLFLGGDIVTIADDKASPPDQSGSSSSAALEKTNQSHATDEDIEPVVELYKTCVCCLELLRKFQLEEFCKPKELCEFLVRKVERYNDLVPMRNVIQKIEAICFGLS